MTFEDKKELAWAAAYGTAFAQRIADSYKQIGEAVFNEHAMYENVQAHACKVADAAVKDLVPGWKPRTSTR